MAGSQRLIDKLIEKWGAKQRSGSEQRCLVRFSGVGHVKADKLYLQLGGRPDSRSGWGGQPGPHCNGQDWQHVAATGIRSGRHNEGRLRRSRDAAGGIAVAEREHLIAVAGFCWRQIAEQERAAAERRLASQVHRAMVEVRYDDEENTT